jgi:alpha-galactosidase
MTLYSRFTCGDMLLGFEVADDGLEMRLVMVPSSRAEILDRLDGMSPPATAREQLVQVALSGETGPGNRSLGRSMMHGSTTAALRFVHQRVQSSADTTSIETEMQAEGLLDVTHKLTWSSGDRALRAATAIKNVSDSEVNLTMATSFCLSGLSPFSPSAPAGNLVVHRLRSAWSAEAKLVSELLEDLQLDQTWAPDVFTVERFGQVGTMPVRGFAPFVGVEDVSAGVTWAAQVAWSGSWQIELCRRDFAFSITGGLADYELGHWRKALSPGAVFTTPDGFLTVAEGSVDECAARLVELQNRTRHPRPRNELDVPVMFNEWCTTWGSVTHDSVVAIAERLKGTGVRYLVIDAGWYGKNWFVEHGDWVADKDKFPLGLGATAAAIRERGLVPGIWFEVETCGRDSAAFSQTEHLLKLDGTPLTAGQRRFWDLNDPFVVDYLDERVIGTLESSGMGYLKVDYNETLGVGCDGAGSAGEGLRRQVEGTYAFFERLRARLPELVVENCASGGHRLDPGLMAYCDVGSSTDAHECQELPIVAANVLRLIPASRSLVWAVVRRTLTARELNYRLATAFLGRLCLSGDIVELDDVQWQHTRRAIEFHGRVAPLLDDATWRRFGPRVESYHTPTGWQALLRPSLDGTALLAVLHTFGGEVSQMQVPIGRSDWMADSALTDGDPPPRVEGDVLRWEPAAPFSAAVTWLTRSGAK